MRPKGLPKSGGRVKGSRNIRTVERETEIAVAVEGGKTPKRYMFDVMNDDKADVGRRDWAANAVAPYYHSKLSSVDHSGAIGLYDFSGLTEDQLREFVAALERASAIANSGKGGTR